MKFRELTQSEFSSFASKHNQSNFYQTVAWGKLKEINNWQYYFVGVTDDKDNIIGASLLLSKKIISKYKMFYAPRGFLIDYSDYDLVSFFTSEIKKYLRSKKGIFIKIDPHVIYKERDKNGAIIEGGIDNTPIYKSLLKLGYQHYGFTNYFDETLQMRWLFRLPLNKDLEKIVNDYSKSTKKNIEIANRKGVEVKVGTINDVKQMYAMLEQTANRRHFKNRDVTYYEHFYRFFAGDMVIYLATINPELYFKNTSVFLEREEKNNQEIVGKMNKEKVGRKLLNNKKVSDDLIEKYKQELIESQEMKGKVLIGCLIAIKSGNEYISLLSGTDTNYKQYNPKYALYDAYIRDAKKHNFEYANFYGISGDFDENGTDYGIYEFKKGFQGEIVELIGEFDLIINKLYYCAYTVLFKLYSQYKKLRIKLKI
ncbi:MAG: peptidoglycan bridge formation glycyltransferase FemA/FemB family protein [Bacilli bacterium]|nr:peptidoglycan bridge formation glycyltransferase FemA/FemB family protein [Bacilli bacterium]